MSNATKAAVAAVGGYFGGEMLAGLVADCMTGPDEPAPRAPVDLLVGRRTRRTRIAIEVACQAAIAAAIFSALE